MITISEAVDMLGLPNNSYIYNSKIRKHCVIQGDPNTFDLHLYNELMAIQTNIPHFLWWLKYERGMKLREIAELLEVPISTVAGAMNNMGSFQFKRLIKFKERNLDLYKMFLRD